MSIRFKHKNGRVYTNGFNTIELLGVRNPVAELYINNKLTAIDLRYYIPVVPIALLIFSISLNLFISKTSVLLYCVSAVLLIMLIIDLRDYFRLKKPGVRIIILQKEEDLK